MFLGVVPPGPGAPRRCQEIFNNINQSAGTRLARMNHMAIGPSRALKLRPIAPHPRHVYHTPTTKRYGPSSETEVTQKTGAPSFIDTDNGADSDRRRSPDQEQTAVTPSPFDSRPETKVERPTKRSPSRAHPQAGTHVMSDSDIISVWDGSDPVSDPEPRSEFENMTTSPYHPKSPPPARGEKSHSVSVPLPHPQQPGRTNEKNKDHDAQDDEMVAPRQIAKQRPKAAEPTFLCDPQLVSSAYRYLGPLIILSMLIMAGVGLLALAYR